MKRSAIVIATFAIVSCFTTLPALAQHGQGHRPPAPGHAPQATQGQASERPMHTSSRPEMNQPTSTRKSPSDLLSQNTKLSSRLQGLLPAGTNVGEAAQGFKNLGEFVAATHVAHNLDIPFDLLKERMTGPSPVSLGKAIKELKPDVNARAEVKKAKKQADKDLKESGS